MASSCKHATRHPLRRRKNYFLIVCILLFAVYAWIELTELDDAFSPLRPLADAESEARRLLALMTHYNYHCNSTAAQVGNMSQWPLCTSHDAGLNLDSKDTKLAYTIGSGSDYTLERNLALNYSFSMFIVTRSLTSALRGVNGTHVVRTTIVANDPADYSRNSFIQRTLNDLLAAHGHDKVHIDLLRLIAPDDSSAVQMWELVHFLIHDNVLRHVQQLHLMVYIEKLDDDYLYSWYRTLYKLFSKAGFHLYHTSSHDTLCLQVTLMQSCVYFLSYIRNPGPHVNTMYPPADYGHLDQEWSRLLGYVSTLQVDCKPLPADGATNVRSCKKSSTCSSGFDCTNGGTCTALLFGRSGRETSDSIWIPKDCAAVTRLVPVVSSSTTADSMNTITHYELTSLMPRHQMKLLEPEKAINDLKAQGWFNIVEIIVPGVEFQIIEQLLASGLLQNVTKLMIYIELPDTAVSAVHPVVLRDAYSRLRRIQSYGMSLFYYANVPSCHPEGISRTVSSSGPNSEGSVRTHVQRCFWIGFVRLQYF